MSVAQRYMTQATIQLLDDLARTLEDLAAAALFEALSAPPRLTDSELNKLEAAITAGRLD